MSFRMLDARGLIEFGCHGGHSTHAAAFFNRDCKHKVLPKHYIWQLMLLILCWNVWLTSILLIKTDTEQLPWPEILNEYKHYPGWQWNEIWTNNRPYPLLHIQQANSSCSNSSPKRMQWQRSRSAVRHETCFVLHAVCLRMCLYAPFFVHMAYN